MFVFPSGNCLTPGCLPSPRLSINPFCTSASHSKRMCGLIWVCLCHIMFDVWYWWLIPIKGVTGQWSGLASALPSPCPCPCLYPCLYYRPRAPPPGAVIRFASQTRQTKRSQTAAVGSGHKNGQTTNLESIQESRLGWAKRHCKKNYLRKTKMAIIGIFQFIQRG